MDTDHCEWPIFVNSAFYFLMGTLVILFTLYSSKFSNVTCLIEARESPGPKRSCIKVYSRVRKVISRCLSVSKALFPTSKSYINLIFSSVNYNFNDTTEIPTIASDYV